MGLIDLAGRGPIALDTAIFIYYIQSHPIYAPLVDPLFEAADRGDLAIVTSAITLLEVLVVPYRTGNRTLADRYEALITRSRGVRCVDLTRDQLRAAAQLRAATGARTPNALQLVAALTARCRMFVTNDRRLPAIPGLKIRQLDDHR